MSLWIYLEGKMFEELQPLITVKTVCEEYFTAYDG